MRWDRQVLHLAARDLCYATWMWGMFAAASALLAAKAAGWPRLQGPYTNEVGMVVLWLLAVCTFAILVQRDSPSRPDAFWAGLPLTPSAVMMAKVVLGCLVVLVPNLLAQFAVFVVYAIPSHDVGPLLATSLGVSAEILLFTMLFAALTPDLRTFLAGLSGFVVAWIAANAMIPSDWFGAGWPNGVKTAVSNLPIATYALLIVYQYTARNTSRSRRMGVVASAVGIVLACALTQINHSDDWASRRVASTVSIAGHVTVVSHSSSAAGLHEQDTVRVTSIRVAHDASLEHVAVRLAISGSRPGDRFDFTAGAVDAYRPPGTTGVYLLHKKGRREAVAFDPRSVALNRPRWPGAAGLEWRNAPPNPTESDTAQINVALTPTQFAALESGDATLGIEGDLATNRVRGVATLPLRNGSLAGMPDSRVQFDSVGSNTNLGVWGVWLRIATIQLDGGHTTWPVDSADFALIQDDRGEALRLSQRHASVGDLSLPAPGASAYVTEMEFAAASRDSNAASAPGRVPTPDTLVPVDPVDRAWLRGARLSVVRWDRSRVLALRLIISKDLIAAQPRTTTPAASQ